MHFVFTQSFANASEIARYRAFMDDVVQLVALDLKGALKAEHGTGRNMAPFVAVEWGDEAYALMWRLKKLFDPKHILNPGVILNEDPEIHLKNLKALPAADPLIDKCIECGFCESVCPARDLSLSPRQRIVVWRAICHKESAGEDASALRKQFAYWGVDSCAMTGLCAVQCPVGINTGTLMRQLKARAFGGGKHPKAARLISRHFSHSLRAVRFGLAGQQLLRVIAGDARADAFSGALMQAVSGGKKRPPPLPRPAPAVVSPRTNTNANKVVYFASCISRTAGLSTSDKETVPLIEKTCQLLEKAGFSVVFSNALENLCCGQPFVSKNYPEEAKEKHEALLQALLVASENGKYPIYCDNSSCSLRVLEDLKDERLKFYDAITFLHDFVLPKLTLSKLDETLAVHVTCSAQHLGQTQKMLKLAAACAKKIVRPNGIACCGFAGDKGFSHPELNASSLRHLRSETKDCQEGTSSARTCEIGLSHASGKAYRHIVYWLDRASV